MKRKQVVDSNTDSWTGTQRYRDLMDLTGPKVRGLTSTFDRDPRYRTSPRGLWLRPRHRDFQHWSPTVRPSTGLSQFVTPDRTKGIMGRTWIWWGPNIQGFQHANPLTGTQGRGISNTDLIDKKGIGLLTWDFYRNASYENEKWKWTRITNSRNLHTDHWILILFTVISDYE
jgi:hypothetical protein